MVSESFKWRMFVQDRSLKWDNFCSFQRKQIHDQDVAYKSSLKYSDSQSWVSRLSMCLLYRKVLRVRTAPQAAIKILAQEDVTQVSSNPSTLTTKASSQDRRHRSSTLARRPTVATFTCSSNVLRKWLPSKESKWFVHGADNSGDLTALIPYLAADSQRVKHHELLTRDQKNRKKGHMGTTEEKRDKS